MYFTFTVLDSNSFVTNYKFIKFFNLLKSHNKSRSYSTAKEKISEVSSIFADFGILNRLFCALDVLRFLFAFVEIGFQQVVLGTEGVLNVGFVQIGYQLLS